MQPVGFHSSSIAFGAAQTQGGRPSNTGRAIRTIVVLGFAVWAASSCFAKGGEPVARLSEEDWFGKDQDPEYIVRDNGQITWPGEGTQVLKSGMVTKDGYAKRNFWPFAFCHGDDNGDIRRHWSPAGNGALVGRVSEDGDVYNYLVPGSRALDNQVGHVFDPDNRLSRAQEAGAACFLMPRGKNG
jgi:hypothetical protein